MSSSPPPHLASERALEVRDLHVRFDTARGIVHALNGIDLDVAKGEVVALVGESGSGKSVTGQTILGILRTPPAVVERGSIRLWDEDLLAISPSRRRDLRGRAISMVFQDALATLNPVVPVGIQLERLLRRRGGLQRRAARRRSLELLTQVGIPVPERRFRDYPHQFSGGMRQRVMIAMAIALDPDVLIADEPTTALDVTIQAQILRLLRDIQGRTQMGVLLITHDLPMVSEVADRVAVIYGGRVVEEAPVDVLLTSPRHPYTEALIRSVPSAASRGRRLRAIQGAPPDMRTIPAGCPFHPRCGYVRDRCRSELPTPRAASAADRTHLSACHVPEEVGSLEPR